MNKTLFLEFQLGPVHFCPSSKWFPRESHGGNCPFTASKTLGSCSLLGLQFYSELFWTLESLITGLADGRAISFISKRKRRHALGNAGKADCCLLCSYCYFYIMAKTDFAAHGWRSLYFVTISILLCYSAADKLQTLWCKKDEWETVDNQSLQNLSRGFLFLCPHVSILPIIYLSWIVNKTKSKL